MGIMVGLMSVALFVEMGLLQPDVPQILEGWIYGFIYLEPSDIFVVTGIMGAVVMPHNLYLHSATIQERKIDQSSHGPGQGREVLQLGTGLPDLCQLLHQHG